MIIKKITYLKKICRVILCISILLANLMIIAGIVCVIKNIDSQLWNLGEKLSELMFAIVVGTALAIIEAIIAKLPKTGRFFINTYILIEKSFYQFIALRIHNKQILNLLVSDFKEENITIEGIQRKVVNEMTMQIKEGHKSIILIEGLAGQGKTSTIFFVYDALIKKGKEDNSYALLNKKGVYIDFSYSVKEVNQFIIDYTNNKYQGNYLFLDNIDIISDVLFQQFYKKILLPYIESNELNSKMLVLLYNTTASMNTTFSRIINELKSSKEVNFYELNDFSTYAFPDYNKVKTVLEKICNDEEDKRALQLWLFRIFSAKYDESYINKILKLDFSQSELSKERVFISIIILCKHSNIFMRKDIRNLVYGILNTSDSQIRASYYKTIKELEKHNIINKFPFNGDTYVFNHIVSRHFRKHLIREKNEHYYELASKHYESLKRQENPTLEWLSYIDLKFEELSLERNNTLFERALKVGNFKYMLKEIELICNFDKRKESLFLKELGILNEKTGNRKEAEKFLNDYIDKVSDTEEKYKTEIILFEIIHGKSFDTSRLRTIQNESNDWFTRFQAKYWIEHINIERGIFQLEEIDHLIGELENKHQSENNWEYYHTLRRLYSDYARVYYLKGQIDFSIFSKIKCGLECSQLREGVNYPEYSAFNLLTTEAHYVHYDLIFQLGFYGQYNFIHDDKYSQSLNELDELYELAYSKYEKCEKLFKEINDKTWRAVSVRKQEISMINNNFDYSTIKEKLTDYERYCDESGYLIHLAFVKCVLVKLEMRNYYRNISDVEFNPIYNNCLAYLEKSESIYREFDNAYGLYRVRFLRLMLDFVKELGSPEREPRTLSQIVENFKNELRNFSNQSYQREYHIIDKICNSKNLGADTPLKIFIYYPIVLQ